MSVKVCAKCKWHKFTNFGEVLCLEPRAETINLVHGGKVHPTCESERMEGHVDVEDHVGYIRERCGVEGMYWDQIPIQPPPV